jgi:hypothetical protein
MQVFKVIVCGLSETGKTTFVNAVGEAVILGSHRSEDWPTLSAMIEPTDLRMVAVDETNLLYLLGIPTLQYIALRFPGRLAVLLDELLGCVVLIDSVKAQEAPLAYKPILEDLHAKAPDVPYVLVANRQDHPDAPPIGLMRRLLQLPDDEILLSCVATDRERVKAVLLVLLTLINNRALANLAIARLKQL